MNKLIYAITAILIFYTLLCGRLCFSNTDEVIEVFNETGAIIYGIWWVRPDQKIATIEGNIADLDLLMLDVRPSRFEQDYSNSNPPSFPFQFNETMLIEVQDGLLKNNQVLKDSVKKNEDKWGTYLSFKLEQYPDYEIRRYPAYMIIITYKILKNKADYKTTLNNIMKIINNHFAQKTEFSELIESYDEKLSSRRQPMFLITHLYVDWETYFNITNRDNNIDKLRPAEELLEMGIFFDENFSVHYSNYTILAHMFLSPYKILLTNNRPAFLDDSINWFGQQSDTIDYSVNRLLRWTLFNDLLIKYVLESTNKIDNKNLADSLKAISESTTMIDFNKHTEFFSQLVDEYEKNNIEFPKKAVNKIDDTMAFLDCLLYSSDEECGKKNYLPTETTFMTKEFIKTVLRYEPGSYAGGESSIELKRDKVKLEILISDSERHLNNINSDYATISSTAFNRISFSRDLMINIIGISISVLIGGFLITMWSRELVEYNRNLKDNLTLLCVAIILFLLLVLILEF